MSLDVTSPPDPLDPDLESDPFDDVDLDDAVASFGRVLADGPLRDDALLAALRADGAWGAVGELPDDDFAAAIDELDIGDTWRTQMAMWFDIPTMLDGRVFTHRLTAAEVETGMVATLPDLTIVDFSRSELRLDDGSGLLVANYDEELVAGAFVGPTGWLDGFGAGDVLGLRLLGADAVRVEHIDPAALPAADSAEVEHLAAALRPCFDRWSNGGGDELAPAALDVLVDVPDAFCTPTLPLEELATAAGLERRGFQFGPADRPWLTSVQAAIRRHADELAHEAPDWLAEPFRRLASVFVDWTGDVTRPLLDAEVGAARSALAQEGVAGLLAEVVRGRSDRSRQATLGQFVDALGGPGDDSAAPGMHHLLGVDASLHRRYPEAEAEFLRVLELDAAQLDAIVELGIAASDRGDVAEADRRFRAAGGPAPWLEALSAILPSRSTGRNDPCPCGSGRKFKQCCLASPKAPVERRGAWYALRLARHLANHDLLWIDSFYDILSTELPDEVDDLDHGTIEDLIGVALGTANSYLDAHDGDLSDVDRGALEAWRDTPFRVWRAAAAHAEGVELHRDGEAVVVPAEAGRLHIDPASGLTAARLVPLGTALHVAASVAVDEISAAELDDLLDDGDAVGSVTEWALWYAGTFER